VIAIAVVREYFPRLRVCVLAPAQCFRGADCLALADHGPSTSSRGSPRNHWCEPHLFELTHDRYLCSLFLVAAAIDLTTSLTALNEYPFFFISLIGVPVVVCCVLGIAWHMYLELRYNGDAIPTGYPSWARKWTCSGFPVFSAKGYFNSTNASLAIGVRRSFGTLHDPQALRFNHQVCEKRKAKE